MAYDLSTPAVLALMGGFMVIFAFIGIAAYVYNAIALMTIARKTKTKNGWLAWIPIANVYLMTQIGKVSGWFTLGVLAVFVPFIGGLIVLALTLFLWWKVAEARKMPGWYGILILIPFVNLIVVGIIAWKD